MTAEKVISCISVLLLIGWFLSIKPVRKALMVATLVIAGIGIPIGIMLLEMHYWGGWILIGLIVCRVIWDIYRGKN